MDTKQVLKVTVSPRGDHRRQARFLRQNGQEWADNGSQVDAKTSAGLRESRIGYGLNVTLEPAQSIKAEIFSIYDFENAH